MKCAYCGDEYLSDVWRPHRYKKDWFEMTDGGILHEPTNLYHCHTHRLIGFKRALPRLEDSPAQWVKAIEALKDITLHKFGNLSLEFKKADELVKAYSVKTLTS